MDTIQPDPATPKGRRERKRYESRQRQAQALELRKAGATYQVIADQLGYKTRDSARKAIFAALDNITRGPAEDVKAMEILRLDSMLMALWTKARQGNEFSIDRVLKIMERRARLVGLDAPTKIAPTDPTGENEFFSITELALALRRADTIIANEKT
jgi:hypothetical protein